MPESLVTNPCKVNAVVDRSFGERLRELPAGTPVWIVSSPTNRASAQRLWKELPTENHLTGITTLTDSDTSSTEELLLSQLDMIDLQHGIHSANPPYTILEVIGTLITERIKSELAQFGFNEFQPLAKGFCAVRPLPA